MKFPDKWWSCPTEGLNGQTVIITGRDGLDPWIAKGKFRYRIDIEWSYHALPDGMPEPEDAELMGEATEAMLDTFGRDPVGVLTGIYTGEGKRSWVFYTGNLRIFGNVLNRALSDLPTIPLTIDASEDPDWEEYRDMREATYIPDED